MTCEGTAVFGSWHLFGWKLRRAKRGAILLSIKAECGNFQRMGVEELQAAVAQLPAEELDRFSAWFTEFLAERWDRQIEADILAGRLNAAGRRADEDFQAGRCTPRSR
jgi:hypothetical protein